MKPWKAILLCILTGILLLAGCGSNGSDSLSSLSDLSNPDVIRSVSTYPLNRRVRLSWPKIEDENIVAYNVYRAVGGTYAFILIGSVTQMASPHYQDEGDDQNGDGVPDGLENNVSVYYKVTALNRNGRETPLDQSPSYPAVPGSLIYEPITLAVNNLNVFATRNEIFLNWTPAEHEDLSGYNVYRSVSGTNAGLQRVAFVPKEMHSFTDGGVYPNEGYLYEVAPVISQLTPESGEEVNAGFLEGLRSQSKIARPLEGDGTIPRPPGSSPSASFALKAESTVVDSKSGVLLQFTRPSANIDGTAIPDRRTGVDDLINGAYLVYRASKLYSKYELVGIVNGIGSQSISEFFDPGGLPHHYYYLKIADASGNLSDRSDIVSAQAAVPPPTIRDLKAKAADSLGGIVLEFTPILQGGVDPYVYNVFRSTSPDRGFEAIEYALSDEDGAQNRVQFTDQSQELMIGTQYWYKVSASNDGLESSLSAPAGSTPGPARGIVVLQGENAAIWRSYLAGGLLPPANHPAQFWPPHWTRTVDANNNTQFMVNRLGLNGAFLGGGVLFVQPQEAASTSIIRGERLDLEWRVDISAIVNELSPGATPFTSGTVSADVWLYTADDSTGGTYKIFLDNPSELALAGGIRRNAPPGQDGTFNGIQNEINFRDGSVASPIRPVKRLLGTLNISNINDYGTNGLPGPETIYMTIVHSGPTGVTSNFGGLKLDALVLVIH